LGVDLGQREMLVLVVMPGLDELEHHVAEHRERRSLMVDLRPVPVE
jgi:hypothetical protein